MTPPANVVPLRHHGHDEEEAWPDDILELRDEPVHIPEGEYRARVETAKIKELFQRRRLILTMRIVISPHAGVSLPFFCLLPKPQGLVSPKSKFFRNWVIAAGRQPRRRDRLGLDVFRGRLFWVLVRDVKHDQIQRPIATKATYSVISTLLEREA